MGQRAAEAEATEKALRRRILEAVRQDQTFRWERQTQVGRPPPPPLFSPRRRVIQSKDTHVWWKRDSECIYETHTSTEPQAGAQLV